MSNPVRQHFIPQSYLRNFAVELQAGSGKYGVEAKLKREEQPKSSLISTKDICLEKNIYTLPNEEGDSKYKIERYYATEVDGIYPEVYSLLVDPNTHKITRDQKAAIVRTTMSLFFRTPKFLRLNEQRMEIILQHAIKSADDKGEVKLRFRHYSLDFNIKEVDEARAELRLQNKIHFLESHLKDWHDFVEYKKDTALTVYKINEPISLISSDNPVVMESVSGNSFSLFDPTNIISLPLDSQHYLTIFPNTEKGHDGIRREERDKWFALTTNKGVERSSVEWIFGQPGAVTSHLADQVKYNDPNAENLKEVSDFIDKTLELVELHKAIQVSGTIFSNDVATILDGFRKSGQFAENQLIQFMMLALIEKGMLND